MLTRVKRNLIALFTVMIVSVPFLPPSHAAVQVGQLATGDSLYLLPWNRIDASPQLFSVDALSGVTTGVGTSGPGKPYRYYWAGAALDPSNGKYYAVDNNQGLLYEVNLSTGVFTEVLQMKLNGSNFNNAYSLAITNDGTTYLSDGGFGLYSLNRVTGVVTSLGDSTVGGISAMAFDPVSGKIYGGNDTYFFEINPNGPTFTTTGNLADISNVGGFAAMQFDSNGTLWFVGIRSLWSADINNVSGAVKKFDFTGDLTTQPYSLLRATASKQTVTFDANGGTGSMSQQSSAEPTELSSNTFSRSGFTFTGWNTLANGTGTKYSDKAIYAFSENLTLYAQWSPIIQANATPTLANTGVSNLPQSYVAIMMITLGLLAYKFGKKVKFD